MIFLFFLFFFFFNDTATTEIYTLSLHDALPILIRYFVDLVIGQISTNMIQALWFDLNRINGGGSRPQVSETFAASKVGVVGAGKGKAHVAGLVGKQVSRGRMTQEEADAFLARITPSGDAADLAGCDVIVEAVFEDQALKHRVLGEAEANALPDALLASNTSTLPITGLAEGVQRPADVVGMHFFSPVDKMPLVELIVGERTSDTALARAYDVVRQIGKTPIVVQDSRGFFTSRVFGTLVLEGAALLAEGLAPTSIERAALHAGFPAGPLTLLDEVTLTLPLKIRDEAAKAGATDDHPGVAVLRALVEQGRTGKSAGKGFFDWEPEKRVWPGLTKL